MLPILALAALLAQPTVRAAPALPQPTPSQPQPTPSRFSAIVTDWEAASREALVREEERAPAPAAPVRTEGQARALGDVVGRMVAQGDCQGGERTAREAADFALVRAVQDHCRAATSRAVSRRE